MADDANMMEQALISEEMGPMGAPSTVPLTITSSGGSTTQAEPAPGQARALQDAQEARALQAQDTREQGEAEAEELRAKAVGADDVATQNMLNLVETQDAIDRNKAAVSAAQAAAEQSHREAEEAASKLKGYDFWANKSTWDRLSAKIAVGLGGIGAAYLGQPNEVLADINRTIDRDFDVQKAYVTSKEHAAELRRKGVADIQAQLEKELAALKVKQGQAIEATSKRAEATLIRAGVPVQQAKTNVAVLGLQATAAEKNADALKDFEVHHTNQGSKTIAQHVLPGQGAPTADQAKVATLSQGMLDEIKTIESLPTLDQKAREKLQNNALAVEQADTEAAKGTLAGLKVRGQRAIGLTPRSKYEGLTPEQQRAANAWDSLIELRARQLTGAGMPEQEARREASTLGPQPGDSPQVLAQKLDRLKKAAAEQQAAVPPAAVARISAASNGGPPRAAVPAVGAPKLTDIQVAQAMEWLRKNPTDPRAPARRAKLRELMGAR